MEPHARLGPVVDRRAAPAGIAPGGMGEGHPLRQDQESPFDSRPFGPGSSGLRAAGGAPPHSATLRTGPLDTLSSASRLLAAIVFTYDPLRLPKNRLVVRNVPNASSRGERL